jgi:hypothetical protein
MKKKFSQVFQSIRQEAKEKTEYDYEGDMARGQLQSIINNSQRVHDMLEDNDNLPEWVQSKITLAEDYISTVANYMMSEIDEEIKSFVPSPNSTPVPKKPKDEYERKVDKYLKKKYNKEEVEQIEEGRPSQRHPLEGHEYHKKTNAELEYIAKDAHKAAEAMKSHNTTAENKYRDQANDSATVRHFRKTSGTPDWYKKKYGHVNESFRPMDEPNYNNSIEARQKKADANKLPFDGPYKKSTGVVTDKSGAKHGPMSQARNLARQAMRDVGDKQKKSLKPAKSFTESKKTEIVKDVIKGKKTKDKFEAEPIISSSPDTKGTIDN